MFHKIIKIAGIDQDVLWNIYNKLWGLFKGPVTIFFILGFLTSAEQGLWYTFLSLGALTIFAELGFTTIITQFVSHEFSKLEESEGALVGDISSLNKAISLIRFSIKFYAYIIPTAIIILSVIGYFYFGKQLNDVYSAWLVFSIIGGLTLFSSLLQSIYQGLDKVKKTQQNILVGSVLMALSNWLLLYFKYGIWALVLGNFIGLIVMLVLLYRTAPLFWKQIYHFDQIDEHNWFNEIINLQWRYALSWISGFFIFFLYVPMVNKYEGLILAGQLGLSLSLIKSINGISYSWIASKIPKFNILVAQKKDEELMNLFISSFWQGVFNFIFFSIIFILLMLILNNYNFYSDRFLNIELTIYLILTQLAQLIIGFLAAYLRSHKTEPFYYLSILNAVLVSVAVLLILPNYGLRIMLISVTLIYYFIILPLAIKIYYNFKNIIK